MKRIFLASALVASASMAGGQELSKELLDALDVPVVPAKVAPEPRPPQEITRDGVTLTLYTIKPKINGWGCVWWGRPDVTNPKTPNISEFDYRSIMDAIAAHIGAQKIREDGRCTCEARTPAPEAVADEFFRVFGEITAKGLPLTPMHEGYIAASKTLSKPLNDACRNLLE